MACALPGNASHYEMLTWYRVDSGVHPTHYELARRSFARRCIDTPGVSRVRYLLLELHATIAFAHCFRANASP
jgi:hypothetical protein